MEPLNDPSLNPPEMSLKERIKAKLNGFVQRVSRTFHSLSPSQLLYFGAILVLILSTDSNDSDDTSIYVAGVMGTMAMAREFWPKFVALWDHLLGRGLLLVLYAIVANLALAASGQKINDIVGVEPSYLIYTLSLTTLFMAPLWLMTVSLLLMLGYVLVLNLMFLSIAMLRLFRVKIRPLMERESFPLLTIVARIIVVPVAVYTLGAAMSVYGENYDDFNFQWFGEETSEQVELEEATKKYRDALNSGDEEAVAQAEKELDAMPKTVRFNLGSSEISDEQSEESENPQENGTSVDSKPKVETIDSMIAVLVFQFETYARSHCNKRAWERIRFVGEEHVLVAWEDNSLPLGYDFTVRTCDAELPPVQETN